MKVNADNEQKRILYAEHLGDVPEYVHVHTQIRAQKGWKETPHTVHNGYLWGAAGGCVFWEYIQSFHWILKGVYDTRANFSSK